MEDPLVLALEALGLGCELLRSDKCGPGSATAAFRPEVAIVINSPVNIPSWPNAGDGLERVKQITDEVCRYWINLCAKLHEHTQCEVVLNNFHPFALPSRVSLNGTMHRNRLRPRWTPLPSSGRDRPFLAVVNFFDLHGPDLAPEPFREMFSERKAPFGAVERLRWRWKQSMDQGQLDYVVDTYDGALAYVDHHLRLLVEELERTSGARRTVVIVTSDHGEQFREHGDIGHGTSLLNVEIQVPLVIYAPGLLRGGKRIETPVSLASIPATILELAGLPPVGSFKEPSLIRLINGVSGPIKHPNPVAELSPIPHGNKNVLWSRSLVTSQWHYIQHKELPEQLFDKINDPGEKLNLAEASDDRSTLLRLRAELNRRVPQLPACTGKS